jgi:hypothetical protein
MHPTVRALLVCGATVVIATAVPILALRGEGEPHARPADRAGSMTIPNLDGVGLGVTRIASYMGAVHVARLTEFAAAVTENRRRVEEEAAQRAAAESRATHHDVRDSAPASPGQGGGGSGCVLPDYICERESGHDYGAVNPTGCGGRGCFGMYQFDPRTYASAGCEGTAQTATPAQQDACASKVYAGGAGASHWGY